MKTWQFSVLTGLLLITSLLTACSDDADTRKLEFNKDMRLSALSDLNKTSIETTGKAWFAVDGKYNENLIFTPTNCSLAVLNELIQADGMRMTLKLYDFRSIRCIGGIKVTPPWE